LLELRGIEKRFSGVPALRQMNLVVRRGTVHVVCGENGAGKSTLMKIINGIHQPDAGDILINGQKVEIDGPIAARALGVSMVSQELNYIPEMTIEQTLFLGEEPRTRFGSIDWKAIRRRTVELLEREGLRYRPDDKLKDLSVADIQMLEILKAVSQEASIIILDEPTSAITSKEVDILFAKVEQLRAKGTGIIYISHRLDELFRIADEISVIRDGSHVRTQPASELNVDTVIQLMVGRPLDNVFPPKPMHEIGAVALEVDGLRDAAGKFSQVSFNVRRGEIVGFAGLMGAGRTEVARAIFGLDPIAGGRIRIDGEETRIRSVGEAMRQGVVMLSEDRKRYGIVPVRSVRENTGLASLERFFRGGRLHRSVEKELLGSITRRMRVKASSDELPIAALSGGNQQKVMLAKWMLRDPRIMILDEPTRGVDVGAKYEIYKIIYELATEGKAVLMISSELPELLAICDRVYVMAHGAITGELQATEFSQERVMRLAALGETTL
jgi:inositol transport system ATP-binding protein